LKKVVLTIYEVYDSPPYDIDSLAPTHYRYDLLYC